MPLRVGLVLLWVLSVWRPADGLAILALFVPFGSAALTWLDAPPVHFTEALVLATLSGAWIASAARSSSSTHARSDAWSALLFCAVVVASLVVVLGARETGVRSPWLELRNLGLFLTHDYLVGPAPEFAGVGDAALLLEGIALMWIARRHSRDRVPIVVGSLAVAAIGAAILALTQALATDAGAQSVMGALLHARASGPVSDVNAAGSFFAMMALVAFGVAIGRRATPAVRGVSSAVAGVLVAAVWLSGSRMALVATIAGGALLAASARVANARQRRWMVGLLALGAAAILIALTVGLDPRPSASRTASSSVSRRADFMITGLRMIGSAPAFGVGIGRYFERSGSFMPESIYWFYFHENAHNNFLQIGGELGLVGLAAFLWLLASVGRRIVAASGAQPDDGLLIGAAVGIGAFVATWLTSHPLLVSEVAYAFWLLVGVTLARADSIGSSASGRPRRLMSPTVAAAALLLVLGSAPVRIAAAQAAQPLDRMTFGFYDWEDDNGFPYRWTSRRATFFVPAGARELRLTLRSMMILGHLDPVTFSVAVNGRVLDSFRITQGNWQTVRLRLPAVARPRGFTRIDVLTDPAWTPAATGANHDVRVLGVQLGRPEAQ